MIHLHICSYFKANWRGALVRHTLRLQSPTLVDSMHPSLPSKDPTHNKSGTFSKNKPPGLHALEHPENQGCSERATWEQSWASIRFGCPTFRDRAKVWQAIVELKRAGGSGRMRIANNEAWTALHDSCGSTSMAATLLSSEEYLLGKRLQEHVSHSTNRWRGGVSPGERAIGKYTKSCIENGEW